MQTLLRRIRGAVGMGVIWAAAWAVVGMAPRWLFGLDADPPFPLIFGLLGFISGVAFGGLLVLTERRRSFDQMSLPRFAAWGATGGLLLSGLVAALTSLGWVDILMIAPTFAVASAACASGSLVLARRAAKRELVEIRGSSSGDGELGIRTNDAGRKGLGDRLEGDD